MKGEDATEKEGAVASRERTEAEKKKVQFHERRAVATPSAPDATEFL